MKQKIIVVGGGFGGVKAALELANKKNVTVTLISNSPNFEYHGALYRSATGNSPLEVVIPLSRIFARAKNVEVLLDTIAAINPRRRTLRSADGNEYAYDKVVLALGNQVNYFGIAGMEEHSYSMITMGQTIALRGALVKLFTRPPKGRPPKVAVIGAGATGVELCGELQTFARKVAKKYRTPVVHPEILLIEGADRVLPMLDPVLSAKAYKRLHKLGVKTQLNTKVNSCEPGKVCLEGGDIEADIIIWTAGSRISDFYENNPRVFKLEKGRVKVGPHLLAEGHDDIYVIGDNAATKFSGMAQTALHDAKFVARDIIARQLRKPSPKYRSWHPIYVVPVGGRWAVLQTGKQQVSGSLGWLARRRADRWIFRNFLPYKQAIKQWRRGNKQADY